MRYQIGVAENTSSRTMTDAEWNQWQVDIWLMQMIQGYL